MDKSKFFDNWHIQDPYASWSLLTREKGDDRGRCLGRTVCAQAAG